MQHVIQCRVAILPLILVLLYSLAAGAVAGRAHADDLQLIAPPDVSSPRATLTSFLENMHEGYRLLLEAYEEHRNDPGFGMSEEVRSKARRAEMLLRRAAGTLDHQHLPPANRSNASLEAAILLMEVLDRLPAPDLERVPDGPGVMVDGPPVLRWQYPGSGIEIAYIDAGPRAGSFLFSADTVDRVHEFYDLVKEFPQRPDAAPDFFNFYTMTPGKLLPPKWAWVIDELPAWMQVEFLDQAVWQWLGLLLVILSSVILISLAWKLTGPRLQNAERTVIARLIMPAVIAFIGLGGLWLLDNVLNVTGAVFGATAVVAIVIIYGAAAYAVYFVAVGGAEWIVALPKIDPGSIDASLVRIVCRLLGILAGIAILTAGAYELGIPVYGVVAGLGVGGLALGLAAKPTLENLIGGLILYADRPVAVGDFCQFGDKLGTIEEIGLRSTRVRALDRSLVTVPNGDFSNKELVNFTRRDRTLIKARIGLRYDTEPEKLRAVLGRIAAFLQSHTDLVAETARTRLVALATYALEVEFQAHVTTADWGEFLRIQEEVLLGVLDIVERSGAAIALPSQTMYFASSMPPGPMPDEIDRAPASEKLA